MTATNQPKMLLHEYIKDNHRIWPNLAAFARAHDMTPEHLNGWFKNGYYVDGKTVKSGVSDRPARIDGVEFKIRIPGF